jgi:Bacterial regulatory helix-turn-helix protein, lysR family
MTAVHRLHHHRAAEPAMMTPMDDRSQREGKVLVLPPAPDAIELRHLRAFVAVAEELNFGRAATRLFVSQPALSRQIRSLERLVGCNLLRRTTHRVELTLAGDALLDRARRLLTDLDDAVFATRSVGTWSTGWPRRGNRWTTSPPRAPICRHCAMPASSCTGNSR